MKRSRKPLEPIVDAVRSGWARLTATDRDRIAAATLAGSTGLAIAAVAFGGFLSPSGALVTLLYLLAILLPAVGVAIVIAVLWALRRAGRSAAPALLEGPPPEAGVTRTEHAVDRETGWALETAAGGWYRCRRNDAADDVRGRLTDGAVRAVTAARGLETEAARDAVRSGTWTDDPVAAAFLATDRRQPLRERLRGAVDPGGAYRRRVRRTLSAIESLEHGPSDRDPEGYP